MIVEHVDPLRDPRWPDLVARHPDGGVFHGVGWLRALQRAYGFDPVALTTAGADEELSDGIVLCRVSSRLTGSRLVSVPFADHCQPLWTPATAGALASAAAELARTTRCRYVELRPHQPDQALSDLGYGSAAKYLHHVIDLEPDLDRLWGALHPTSVRQRVRRAERDGVLVRRGCDQRLLDQFYALLLKTRRKHGLPPQPRSWFTTIADELDGTVVFHVASLDGEPVAGIVTTVAGAVHTYKYGCSDPERARISGTQLLLWQAIEAAKEAGASTFDMGRTDLDNAGLRAFKQRWGATERPLAYLRAPASSGGARAGGDRMAGVAGQVFSRLPDGLLVAAGRHLYRHVG